MVSNGTRKQRHAASNNETVFIFDVFDKKYSLEIVKENFKEVQIIYEESSLHSLKRLYCLGLYT